MIFVFQQEWQESDSGQYKPIFCYGDRKSGDASEKIWEAYAEIKHDKLYLEIKKMVLPD